MSYPALTPTRPLPGTFFQTPAASTFNNGALFQTRTPSASAAQPALTTTTTLQKLSPAAPKTKSETLSTRERAARTINDTLAQEARYPDLDNYLSRASIEKIPRIESEMLTFCRRFFVRLRDSCAPSMGSLSQDQDVQHPRSNLRPIQPCPGVDEHGPFR
jgi:hypothetical protein